MKHEITFAAMVDFSTIRYYLKSNEMKVARGDVKLFQGDRQVALTDSENGWIRTSEQLDIAGIYEIEIAGVGRRNVVPTAIFDCEEFISRYTYNGDDLGAIIQGNVTQFKLWAPTASKVVLNLYAAGNGCDAYQHVEMTKGENGVWCAVAPCGHGTYYTYTVTTVVGTQEAIDPYARSAGVNGHRGMVIDLSYTDPENWDAPYHAGTDAYTKAVIWEIHVRDFSNKIADCRFRGKYLAFTEQGLTNRAGISVGLDHLKQLGITHVHLLPVYDYATVDEADPDSGFNWGYDPQNFNVPEGSYATDPYDGAVRVREYKQMVRALHDAGIGVVMDMVYNHTYDANNALNRIVPYYYYRFDEQGNRHSASCCGNDTASERYMFRKFMVDSVKYWMQEYRLDGVRFDLMGLHDLQTMDCIEKAVHGIDPHALIYGEGWTMGKTMDGSVQADQVHISGIHATPGSAGAVAVFNDTIRDGLKGAYDAAENQGYINGNYAHTATQVRFGIMGGGGKGSHWQVKDHGVINYMSAHDNHTLWDKLTLSNPNATEQERLAMNRLGAAIVMTSLGTPFWQAGEEMLRTKLGDENSYRSSDHVNNLDWEALTPDSDAYQMLCYYRGLISMRKSVPLFTARNGVVVDFADLPGGGMVADFRDESGNLAKVVINPTEREDVVCLSGSWKLLADGTQAGDRVIRVDTGKVCIPARSILVYI